LIMDCLVAPSCQEGRTAELSAVDWEVFLSDGLVEIQPYKKRKKADTIRELNGDFMQILVYSKL